VVSALSLKYSVVATSSRPPDGVTTLTKAPGFSYRIRP